MNISLQQMMHFLTTVLSYNLLQNQIEILLLITTIKIPQVFFFVITQVHEECHAA